MAYQLGAGSKACAAIQSAFGTAASSGFQLLNMRSESISTTVSKTSEDTLLESKTTRDVELESVTCAGSISTYLRPDFVDWLFEAALGSKSNGTYTLSAPDAAPKFSTIWMERGSEVNKYADMSISNLTLTCNAQKIVEASIDFLGVKEETGTYPSSVGDLIKKSYKCTDSYLKIGTTQLPVETLSLTINNGLQEGPRTYLSTKYASEPVKSLREVLVNWTMPKDSNYATFRTALEADTYVSLELQFSNGTSGETVKITMPNVSILAANANVAGTSYIDSSISGKCVHVGSTEPITVVVAHPSAS